MGGLVFEGEAITPSSALGVHVLERMRRLIITRELKPGTHLVESQLSSSFDVSRGPIRDALKQLEIEGLVESRRRGMFVVGLTEDDIEELYSLRGLIELHALRCAMGDADCDWELVQEPLERMRAAAQSGDARAFAEADLRFHSTFYRLSRHRRLTTVWHQYEPTFAVLLDLTNAQDRDLRPTLHDHEELLAAARASDVATVERLLDEHMKGSKGRLLTAHRSPGNR